MLGEFGAAVGAVVALIELLYRLRAANDAERVKVLENLLTEIQTAVNQALVAVSPEDVPKP